MNYADAIIAAVQAGVPADVKVYDSIVSDAPPPARHVILYIPDVLREMTSIQAVSDAVSCAFQATTVTSNSIPAYAGGDCRWLAGKVASVLTDMAFVPDGMARAVIVQDSAQPPRPDEATPDKKVYATAQFSFRSVQT